VLRILRIGISLALMAVIVIAIDWRDALAQVSTLNPALLTLVIAAYAIQLCVTSWKWRWALRIHELRYPYGFLTRAVVIGFYLNNFLPTSIGGDAFRIYRTLPTAPPESRAVSAVVLERLVGLFALLILGLVGALLLYPEYQLARAYVALITMGTVAVVLLIAVLRWLPIDRLTAGTVSARWIAPVRENLRYIRQARGEWLPLVGISLLFQAQAILVVNLLFMAIHEPVSIPQAAMIAAIAGIAAVVPLSINGFGIVEASIAVAAAAVGPGYEAGLIVALLMRILIVPLTLLAGLAYALEPGARRDASTVRAHDGVLFTTANTRNLRSSG
jgi:glycosyltransferase 2 family protein